MAIIKPEGINLEFVKHHSSAEGKIFKEFLKLDESKTKDWIVYYSCYFKGAKNRFTLENREGHDHNEIDFLILAPDVGIFVFEIKGGGIGNDHGQLISTDRNGKEHKIFPYDQAKDNYYAIVETLGKIKRSNGKEVRFKNFAAATLVGFPDADSKLDVGNVSNGHDTYVKGTDLYTFITENAMYFDKDKIVPTKEDVVEIEKALRGRSFEYSLSKANYIKEINLSIDQLTEEQETVFKGLLDNKRCLVKGAAGTGKTVLCEFLYKYLVEEKKYSVIYFTFNRLISESIQKSIDMNENSGCYPIMDYLEDLYKKYSKKELPENWDEKKKVLFNECYEMLCESQKLKKYDCLIIDEAQDVDDSEETFCFFNKLLNGGFENGMCYLFYDDNQKIFDGNSKKIYGNCHFEDYRYAKFKLTRNCRNGQNVNNSLNVFIERNKNTDKLVSAKNGLENEDVKVIETVKENAVTEIKKIIDELQNKESGVDKNQITVLFNRKTDDKNQVWKSLKNIYKDCFIEFKPDDKKELTYSTVGKFKGLENDVIIYVNDNPYSKSADHYVAISRAKALAYIVIVS